MSKPYSGIEISAVGVVHAPYDVAHFKITVSGLHDTGPKAKAAIEKTSRQLLTYVDSLVQDGKAFNKVLALSIDPHTKYEGNTNVHKGYRANFGVTFSTSHVDKVLQIQEKLTEFDQSKVESVTYGFSDVETLREQALANAWKAAQRRWENQQRTVLPLGVGTFRLKSWNVDYSEQRAFSKVSAPTEDEAGLASISVTLRVYYASEE